MAKNIFSQGIDVSKWQGRIDWQKVKTAGIQFAILRAGYGDTISYPSQKDETFEYNYSECKRLGIPVGVYWYSYATTVEAAKQEARSCIATLKGKCFEYPVYYDVEETRIFNTGKTNEIGQAFFEILEAAGYFTGWYTFRSAADNYLNERSRTRYTMAIAEYNDRLNYNGSYDIWQYSSTGRVNGISTNVDLDYCYTDFPTIIKQRGKNGYTTSKTKNITAVAGDTFIHGKKVYKVVAGTTVTVNTEGVKSYEVY